MKECPTCRRCYPDETNHCPQDGDETAPSLLGEPTLDARYLLERRLGQGGMGVVFQARHIFLKTPHARKVILPDLVGNDPIEEGVKMLDFGLAKIKSGELLGSFIQAQTSGLMGSPFYMAPEQWSDEEPDARADIYSLGIILYQMLAGEVPFKGSSIPSIMKKHLTLPPPSLQSMGVSVPPAVEAVVRHALEKEVGARIDSVPNFLRELHAALNSSPVVASALRETVAMDPNRTIASVVQPEINRTPDLSVTQQPNAQETNFGASFDSLAGTVSSAQLEKDLPGAPQKQRAEEDRL